MNSKLPERPKKRNYGLRAGQSSVLHSPPTGAETALNPGGEARRRSAGMQAAHEGDSVTNWSKL
jgi:hypothetical protein